jgi:hypothetical protein
MLESLVHKIDYYRTTLLLVEHQFKKTALREVRGITAATVMREIEGKEKREFPVFLIIGRK